MRRKKKKSLQNKIAMVSVTFVVGVLFIGLMAESSRLVRDEKERSER